LCVTTFRRLRVNRCQQLLTAPAGEARETPSLQIRPAGSLLDRDGVKWEGAGRFCPGAAAKLERVTNLETRGTRK
jgi:hypothetical protein